jgi:hypothetical protein
MGTGALTILDQGAELLALCERELGIFVQLRLRELPKLDAFGEIDLALHRQEIGFANLLKIQSDRIPDARWLISGFQSLFLGVTPIAVRMGGRVIEYFDTFGDEGGIELIDPLDLLFGIRKERKKIVSQQVSLRAPLFEKI